MHGTLVEPAPAKVNLALHVTGRRADGYHELESLVVFAEVADKVAATPARSDGLVVTGPFADAAGRGDGNLAARALAAFRSRFPTHLPEGISLELRKNLPVAAGLGGGSADAAAALRLLARLSGQAVDRAALAAIAAGLGADVPACLLSRPCTVRGIGEIVSPLSTFPPCFLVLVNPLQPVVTAEVFRRLERRSNPGLPPLSSPLTRPAQLGIWLDGTRNDLELPARALLPTIDGLLARMAAFEGCLLARMSGSGATVFGLFGSGAQAHQAAHELRARFPRHWVAAAPVIAP